MNQTHYAIRRVADGAWLAFTGHNTSSASLWLPADESAGAWTWDSMTSAIIAAMDINANYFEPVLVNLCRSCGDAIVSGGVQSSNGVYCSNECHERRVA